MTHMGGYQNYGPFLGTLNIRGRIIIGTQKGTIILTTSHMWLQREAFFPRDTASDPACPQRCSSLQVGTGGSGTVRGLPAAQLQAQVLAVQQVVLVAPRTRPKQYDLAYHSTHSPLTGLTRLPRQYKEGDKPSCAEGLNLMSSHIITNPKP